MAINLPFLNTQKSSITATIKVKTTLTTVAQQLPASEYPALQSTHSGAGCIAIIDSRLLGCRPTRLAW